MASNMSSEAGDMCEVNLHLTPLAKSHIYREVVEDDLGEFLPSWIQHSAVIFIWRDADKCLCFEGVVENDKSVGKVREMGLREGEQQPGTKVPCGKHPLSIEHVKDVAATVAASPPDDDQFEAICYTTVKQLLDELGIAPSLSTASAQVPESTMEILQALYGDNDNDDDDDKADAE